MSDFNCEKMFGSFGFRRLRITLDKIVLEYHLAVGLDELLLTEASERSWDGFRARKGWLVLAARSNV